MTLRKLIFLGAVAVAQAELVKIDWDIRDWDVDFLRPTISTQELCKGRGNVFAPCGGFASKTARELPFSIPHDKLKAGMFVNGQYPGPLLEANEGDDIEVTLHNNLLGAATTIHWHGLHQRGTPSMDGVHGVTQAPILPGDSFTYRFKANPPGTFYYHAHMDALQQSRGIKGPIVIHPKVNHFKDLYSEEMVVMVSDEWRDPEACFKLDGAMPGNPVCSDSEYASFNGQWGDGSDEYPYPLFTVKPNTCYRFRWINSGGNSENFIIRIEGHQMTMIAVDGSDVKPVKVSSFNVHNGERTDVVLCTDQEPGYYQISAEYDYGCTMLKGKTFTPPGFHPVEACRWYAFLHYENTRASLPKKHIPWAPHYEVPKGTGGGAHPRPVEGVDFDTTLRSGWTMAEPLIEESWEDEPVDLRLVMNVGLTGDTHITPEDIPLSRGRWYSEVTDQRRSWVMPETPILHTKGLCGADKTPLYQIPENVTNIELVINNLSPTEHVMHLHGHYFRVTNYADFTWCGINKTECFVMPEQVNPCPAEDREFGDPDHKWTSVPDFNPIVGETPFRLPRINVPLYWGCKYNEKKDRKTEQLRNPMWKDTMSLWQRSWAVIRFKANNPGSWLFHCHLQPHIPQGMIMAFNSLPSQHPPIPEDVPTSGSCPVWSWKEKYQKQADAYKLLAEHVDELYGPSEPEISEKLFSAAATVKGAPLRRKNLLQV